MASTPKNFEALGLILLLLILSGQSAGSSGSRLFSGFGGPSGLSSLGKSLQLDSFARDMHRIVDMMDQFSGLRQIAGAGQLLTSQDQSHIGGAAQAVAGSFSGRESSAADSLSSLNIPDMQQLMEMAGPLMAMLGNQNK